MSKEQFARESSYRVALSIAKEMLRGELITQGEYVKIDTILAKKFSPVWGALVAGKP